MKVLRIDTSDGTYFSDGAHPDKIALMLKILEADGIHWQRMQLLEMEEIVYRRIPATRSAARIFGPMEAA